MTVQGFTSSLRQEEMRRFMIGLLILAALCAIFLMPSNAHAAFNGSFGPNADLTKNTTDSLKGWWKTVAGWGLWLSIGGLLFSIIFAGGKWWWIPVCVFLVCLFGEPAITQIAQWSGFNTTATGTSTSGT